MATKSQYKIGNLNIIQSADILGTDKIQIVRTGEFNRTVEIDDLLSLIELNDGETIVETAVNYDAQPQDDYVSGAGTITLKFPLLTAAIKGITFKNNGVGTITLDGNGSSVENGTVLSTTVARKFIPVAGGWIEV